MNKLEELKVLLAQAGKWPTELQSDGTEGFYECPTCNGEGTVDAELVKRAHAGCVGVQVYGIGDEMEAMEKLLPLLFMDYLPRLIAVAEAAAKVGCTLNDHTLENMRHLQTALEPLTKDADK